jgi:hypothetical protein
MPRAGFEPTTPVYVLRPRGQRDRHSEGDAMEFLSLQSIVLKSILMLPSHPLLGLPIGCSHLKMEAEWSSETSAPHITTRRHSPEERHEFFQKVFPPKFHTRQTSEITKQKHLLLSDS